LISKKYSRQANKLPLYTIAACYPETDEEFIENTLKLLSGEHLKHESSKHENHDLMTYLCATLRL
jgi:hypothetical protein